MSRYQQGKTYLDFIEARGSEWQWHQLGHMQVCTSLQADNHASTPPLSFLQAECPSFHPTNIIKALKANNNINKTRTDKVVYVYSLYQYPYFLFNGFFKLTFGLMLDCSKTVVACMINS